ncbi:MAG: peptide chain release factor N(5)-glutamine methyltransferase [Clostridiales bacterium]|nr:peptide chain release factor N(5)-glutamine methyltransferase [Clostridiales bacterium]
MTYREIRTWAAERLRAAGVENESAESGFLMEYACGMSLGSYLLRPVEEIPECSAAKYRELVGQRCRRIPLQHLTGVQEFMGLPFEVNEHVLIPRQDTELLAEQALEILRGWTAAEDAAQIQNPRVLDLCTGSGCIAVSLKTLCPQAAVYASDVSREALAVAQRNAAANHADVQFTESNLFSGISGAFHMIVSNPPYIPRGEIPSLMPEVRDHEPMLALDGEEDGLEYYRRIARECRDFLLPGGWLLFEIGWNQGDDVAELMRENSFSGVEVIPDLAELDRVVRGRTVNRNE